MSDPTTHQSGDGDDDRHASDGTPDGDEARRSRATGVAADTEKHAGDADDGSPVQLSSDWVEKDGEVINKKIENVLPQVKPAEGPAPLP